MVEYLIIGTGLFGAVCVWELTGRGRSVMILDKRSHFGGNAYAEATEGRYVHRYGAHIFHTNNKVVWDYANCFAVFIRYTNSPVGNYKDKLYSLPFNMYTFNKMWNMVTLEEAAVKIAEQRKEIIHKPQNLEKQAISLVGRDVYELLKLPEGR